MVERPVDIAASATGTGYGGFGAGGDPQSSFEGVLDWIDCNIQPSGHGGRPEAPLPADSVTRPFYDIYVPAGAVDDGTIQYNDRITDDLGRQFQVSAQQVSAIGSHYLAQQISV